MQCITNLFFNHFFILVILQNKFFDYKINFVVKK